MKPTSEGSSCRLAYLAPELGAVTSTFVYREVQELRRMGDQVALFSTIRPAGPFSAEARPIVEETHYLYETPGARVLGAVAAALFTRPGGFARGLACLLRDMIGARVSFPSDRAKLVWHFCMGCVLAGQVRRLGLQHVHAHFAHVPASIAMYAAIVAGVSFSFTAHANDIFARPVALKEKVARSAFTVCISDHNRRHLTEAGCLPDRLTVVHCGIDTDRYAYRTGKLASERPELLAVGRFVEKKGFAVLAGALGLLASDGRDFHCRIVGDGPLFAEISGRIAERGLADCVDLPGALPQEEVKQLMETADVFVLPCVMAASGDRDGIPVVLIEAMALGTPVVSTRVSGIPELIRDGVNGMLAEPNDPESLAAALRKVLDSPQTAGRLAFKARETVVRDFDLSTCVAKLRDQFRSVGLGEDRTAPMGKDGVSQ